MVFVVDIECLRGPDSEFVVKELAICNLKTSQIEVYHLLPPYPEYYLQKQTRKTNSWISNNIHGIAWDDGYIGYDQLTNILQKAVDQEASLEPIYAKGVEKSDFILSVLDRPNLVINLDNVGCPKPRDLFYTSENPFTCFVHTGNSDHCALLKCAKFAAWMHIRTFLTPFLPKQISTSAAATVAAAAVNPA